MVAGQSHRGRRKFLAVVPKVLPELRPAHLRRSADENVRVIDCLLVLDPVYAHQQITWCYPRTGGRTILEYVQKHPPLRVTNSYRAESRANGVLRFGRTSVGAVK